jgi:Flp pilus assembly protein TadD
MSLRTFEHTWARSGFWAFVALPPGQWPRTADQTAVVQAAVGFERLSPPATAGQVYASALQRFPNDLVLAMGLGNSRYLAGDLRGAEAAFAQAAAQHDSAPAWVNLALTRRELGDAAGAAQAAERARTAAEREPTWQDAADALGKAPATSP